MKPTKMRNQMIYRASQATKSKQVSSPLSKDLKNKYSKNSVRVVEGDTVKIVRGEFKGVDGKKEKTKGDKFDVYIHSSNVIVTGLNTSDKWRMAKLEGKKPSSKPKETPTKETKVEKPEEKEAKE
jgi:large subunit ribosomal protein L24